MDNKLFLNFHGRIIDHLGIQMYQSPTAAIAEMVSNAWDADATEVDITLPTHDNKTIVIKDNGVGMTFEECQKKFLTVGFDKRKDNPNAKSKLFKRDLMGRKGIGKFAGFGISEVIEICTISKETGEKTNFTLDLNKIRSSDDYVKTESMAIDVTTHTAPSESEKENHGTIITLKSLKISRLLSEGSFGTSMARRFAINSGGDDFLVKINGSPMPVEDFFAKAEYSFPKDYATDERPDSLTDIDSMGYGKEIIDGYEIKWRVFFLKETIKDDELQGISIYAHKKLAQRPFIFNLTGGLPSQNGPEYMTGSVIADYLDEFNDDVISTERQRLNWSSHHLAKLEEWGQKRVRELLRIWKDRRADEKTRLIESKIDDFRNRLDKLGAEKKTVIMALKRIASIQQIGAEQFRHIGNSILTAWEGGRLKELIRNVASVPDMDGTKLLEILIEANTIQALHTAESVKAKLDTISGLETRIRTKELENAVRDYIAKNPWLIAPKWETYAIEKNVQHIAREAAVESGIEHDPAFKGRVDLVLSSGEHLLVLEFMRPGLKIDKDHVNRFEEYVNTFRVYLDSATGSQFKRVSGYLVADDFLKRSPTLNIKLKTLRDQEMYTLTWEDLLSDAKRQWREFLEHLSSRAPGDQRMKELLSVTPVQSTDNTETTQ
ncbi:ATP-binding protein [Klebsiella pneumoniae]|uniref:ATP-binding protein n=1 Tax=Klebsiella pneumoniae TaxID=573 RepID=UPI002380FE00|nr:ATP-binding protein [Klebsiella pneumoniae]MDE4824048.1 ATP-binding protein [Klebsiella pneumoniae]